MNNCINSSKVYCKFRHPVSFSRIFMVLIVAKCIVNSPIMFLMPTKDMVLIVAKCIVNSFYFLVIFKIIWY